MLINRHSINLTALFAILFLSFAQAAEPRPKTRMPDDRMLQEPDRKPLEIRAPLPLDYREILSEATTMFSELPLAGARGKETPHGNRYGRYCENAIRRAGLPNCISRFAKSSTDANHQVGYVGGGTLFGGSCRRIDEGTFGMDYAGLWYSRKIWLKWSHGERHQGGAGRYETEGPRLLPE